jgi:hypothetical protein
LFCYAASPHFVKVETPRDSDEVVQSIGREIDCKSWRQWHEGKSPQEHEEMTILEQVRSEQADFRRNEEDLRLKWRKEDTAAARTTRIIAMVGVGAAILSGAVALIALFVSLSR